MVIIRSHVLECPTVIYRKGSEIPVIDRKARWKIRGKTVFSSQSLGKWETLRIVRGPNGLQRDRGLFETAFDGFFNTLTNTLVEEDKVIEVTESWTITVGRGKEDALMEIFCGLPKSG